jgi:very-short-patch-repair endonuclease
MTGNFTILHDFRVRRSLPLQEKFVDFRIWAKSQLKKAIFANLPDFRVRRSLPLKEKFLDFRILAKVRLNI